MLKGLARSLSRRVFRRLPDRQQVAVAKILYGDYSPIGSVRSIRGSRASLGVARRGRLVPKLGFDSHQQATDNVSAVRELLNNFGIEYVTLPAVDELEPTLVVRATFAAALKASLATLLGEDGWFVESRQGPYRSATFSNLVSGPQWGTIAFVVGRRVGPPHGKLISGPQENVTVQLWSTLSEKCPREDGSRHSAGTLHAAPMHDTKHVSYLTSANWAVCQTTPEHRIDMGGPLARMFLEPIDLVYTWVDGEDPQWLEQKLETLGTFDLASVNETASVSSRFYSRDELKYSIRSVEMYANWVRRIYIVTDGQVPTWLDTSHPKIFMVDHRDIFADPAVLPVFNSHAIESQLHRIPGLSERYLYLNDDVFFARPVSQDLFFTSSGLSKFFPAAGTLDIDDAASRDMPVMSAAKNNRTWIRERSGRIVTRKFKHTPHSQIRSILEELEIEDSELFRQLASSKVRHPSDHSIAASLHHHFAYARGRGVEGQIGYGYVDVSARDAELQLIRLQQRQDMDVFCINETNTPLHQQRRVDQAVKVLLEQKYPLKSSFEL